MANAIRGLTETDYITALLGPLKSHAMPGALNLQPGQTLPARRFRDPQSSEGDAAPFFGARLAPAPPTPYRSVPLHPSALPQHWPISSSWWVDYLSNN